MTEIDEISEISPAIRRFILHWGDMGGQWGVNRSVAQIHAFLLVSDRPRHADEIVRALGVARSNVSNSLKDLMAWDLVRRVPIEGDRRDHFAADDDVWEMVTKIVAMRKARELDPAKEVLNQCLDQAKDDPHATPAAVKRLSDLQALIATLDEWYGQMNGMPKSKLLPLIRLGAKAVDLLSPFVKNKPVGKS